MPKYKFSDIAENITEKGIPSPGDEALYIGLEHLDSGSLKVSRWGSDVPIKGQKLIMRQGDVLFGRRNTYLRRAAIAPHDGFFSAHGMIFRPKGNVIDPAFFPFFISSSYFMDEAIRISVGSLSPTVNWKTLKELEFALPDMDEQRKLAEILSAANEAKEAYKELLRLTDELVKSQFIEMFGDPISNDRHLPLRPLSEIATSRLGKMLDKKKQPRTNLHYYLANQNVQWFELDLSVLNQMDFDSKEQIEFALRDGDLLVCEGGVVGRCAIWHDELEQCYFQKAIHRVRCNLGLVKPEYLMWSFKIHSDLNAFEDVVGKSTIAHLPGIKLKGLLIPLPSITAQDNFVDLLRQTDKSKFELKQTIDSISGLIRSLMQQDFCD